MKKVIIATVAAITLGSVSIANAQQLKEGQYVVGPGVGDVIEVPVPKGVVLDDFGCAYIAPAVYKCFVGMLAQLQFTSKAEAINAGRYIFNAPTRYSVNQMNEAIRSGRGYQIGLK